MASPSRHTTPQYLTPRTNSRSALQGYPLRFWAPLRSAPSAVHPTLVPASQISTRPPLLLESGLGPPCTRRRPTSFSQSERSPFHQSKCATYVGHVYYASPPPGSIASSPARPRPLPVRPNSVLQPCPFGGPVLLFSAAAAQLTLSSAELLRTMGVCRSATTCNFIQGRYPGRRHYP